MTQATTQVKSCQFNLLKFYPTDWVFFVKICSDIKKLILQHGPCRPGGSFECIKEDGSVSTKFRARLHGKDIKNISVPRIWFCYSIYGNPEKA